MFLNHVHCLGKWVNALGRLEPQRYVEEELHPLADVGHGVLVQLLLAVLAEAVFVHVLLKERYNFMVRVIHRQVVWFEFNF